MLSRRKDEDVPTTTRRNIYRLKQRSNHAGDYTDAMAAIQTELQIADVLTKVLTRILQERHERAMMNYSRWKPGRRQSRVPLMTEGTKQGGIDWDRFEAPWEGMIEGI